MMEPCKGGVMPPLIICTCLLVILLIKSTPTEAAGQGSYDNHECRRECENPPSAMTCQYNFTIEWFYAMSKACYDCPYNLTDCARPHCMALNGVPRPVTVVNRMFPGPSIEVCKGDTIQVEVSNQMQNGDGASIHWHGLPQRNSPYMDGVSMVTQCPITEFTNFQYEMVADHAGTHWWHSHSGMQRSDGVFGALIVREPREVDVHSALFDYDLSDHVILIHDWFDITTMDKFSAHRFGDGSNRPESVLINGKGQRAEFYDEDTNTTHFTAREVFSVQQGSRYRFRVISNAITDAPLKVSIDGHNLTMIASDGGDFEPINVNAFVIYGGERFDFVITANNTPGNYWMQVKGLADASFVQELAIIRYMGAPSIDPTESETYDRERILQDLNEPASDRVYTINQLISKTESVLPQENKRTFYVAFDFYKVNNYNFPDIKHMEGLHGSHHLYAPQITHVSLKFPSSPPLSQPNDVVPSQLCDSNDVLNMTHCATEYCECTHVISVELGETVEIILIDEGVPFDSSHPFHLHGYSFRVVGQDRLNSSTSRQEVMELDKAGAIPRNIDNAPLKDTVIVPDGGYTIIQFVADNPGWWLMHCHLEFHVTIGMGLLVHVGTESDLPPVPENFPRCGNWPNGVNQPADLSTVKPTSGSPQNVHPVTHPLYILIMLIVLLCIIYCE